MDGTFVWHGDDPSDATNQIQLFVEAASSNLEDAAEDISVRIMDDAKHNAPVDTGALRDSIDQEVERLTEHAVKAIVKSEDVHYAMIQEVEQPFLRPAIESNESFIRDRIETALSNAVTEVA